MKKSQLRNIIRESIKELMTEHNVGDTMLHFNAPLGTLPQHPACHGSVSFEICEVEPGATYASQYPVGSIMHISVGSNNGDSCFRCDNQTCDNMIGVVFDLGTIQSAGPAAGVYNGKKGKLVNVNHPLNSHYAWNFCQGTCGNGNFGGPCPYPGCTDSTASNYAYFANVDDGSCIAVIYGCTDPSAFNYDAAADIDDGNCDYGWRCGMLPSGGAVAEQVSMPTGCMPGTSTDIGVFSNEGQCLSQNTNIPNGCGGTDMGALVKPLDVEPKSADIKRVDPEVTDPQMKRMNTLAFKGKR